MSETLTYRPDDFDGAKAVRIRVFMEEQGFKNEFDGVDQDPRTLEVAVRDADDTPVGCARVFPSELEQGIGTEEGCWVFGRLAVVPEHRHGGLGSKILAYSEEEARMRGAREMHLHAQLSVMPFYERAGYEPYGPVELDEHVEHRWMQKQLGQRRAPTAADAWSCSSASCTSKEKCRGHSPRHLGVVHLGRPITVCRKQTLRKRERQPTQSRLSRSLVQTLSDTSARSYVTQRTLEFTTRNT